VRLRLLRVAELPWFEAGAGDRGSEAAPAAGGYEDWYLIEDFAALGVLNEAAVGRGHRSAHDQVARRFGVGAGGMYGLLEGERPLLGEGWAPSAAESSARPHWRSG